MTYLTDLTALVESSPLPSLVGDGRGSVRGMILDAMDRNRIEFLDAFELLKACNRRLQGDDVRQVEEVVIAGVIEPPRRPVPPLVILPEQIVERCAGVRWLPDEQVRSAETAHEQLSRIENYRLAVAVARLRGRDLERQRDRDAIWAAVAAEVAVWVRSREREVA